MRKAHIRLALVAMVVLAGCESPFTAPGGAIALVQEPYKIGAPWRIEMPSGAAIEGYGDRTVSGLQPGTYVVVWLDAWGYAAPVRQAVDLTMDATPLITGVYHTAPTLFPDTPENLMADLRYAYQTKNLSLYANLVSTDHRTFLQQVTRDAFPELGRTLDVAEERRLHQRMFSNAGVIDPDGELVPAVSYISASWTQQGEWTLSPPDDPIPGTLCAIFNVSVDMSRTFPTPNLWVRGPIRFYITKGDTVVEGVPRLRYRLRGQVDLTENSYAVTGPTCWGTVKAIFR